MNTICRTRASILRKAAAVGLVEIFQESLTLDKNRWLCFPDGDGFGKNVFQSSQTRAAHAWRFVQPGDVVAAEMRGVYLAVGEGGQEA